MGIMASKKKRANYNLHVKTLEDLRYAQEAFRVTSQNTTVDWCIRFMARMLRLAASGHVLLALDPRTGVFSPLDIPGQDLTKASEAVSAATARSGS